MPLELYHDCELPHVLRWDFRGRWTWREYHDCAENVSEMIRALNADRVDIIVDLTKSDAYPPGIVQEVLRGTPLQPEISDPAWGITVLVGGGLLVRVFFHLLQQMHEVFRKHYCLADSMSEARLRIQQERRAARHPV